MSESIEPATIKAKVTMTAMKIHGPNSTLASEGTREGIQCDEPEQYVELTYDQAVEMFGAEKANELFGREPH